jgi:hypothetical protein
MKLKNLAIVAVVILGCSAAFAQGSYSFGFLSYTGGFEYCNYEQFTTGNPFGGTDPFFLQGTDNLAACGSLYNATIEGVAITVPAAAKSGVPKGIQGKGGYVYADNVIDAQYLGFSQEQWLVITKTAVTPVKNNHWSWVGYVSYGGQIFGLNYGFLTTTLPAAENASHGATIKGLNHK